jgi:hypothetical protein
MRTILTLPQALKNSFGRGTALSEIKRHYRPASLMMRQFPEKEWGNLAQVRSGVFRSPAQPELDRERVSERWVEKIRVLHPDILRIAPLLNTLDITRGVVR